METSRFDAVSRLLATRRTRRQALTAAGALAAAGLVTHAAASQEATPAADGSDPTQKIPYLFVQSFQSGSIAPKGGEAGTFTVTLDHGLGQTLYFSDRPARDVGATPTSQFLAGLNFSASNPPNAALLFETANGATDIAVIELYSPTYDEASFTATYDVKVLQDWEDSTDLHFSEAPADLAALASSFGAAHLFIDDCADSNLSCCPEENIVEGDIGGEYCTKVAKDYGTVGYCAQYGRCVPCEPFYHDAPSYEATWNHWQTKCTVDDPDACPDNGCEAGWWLD
jgi:hypothetical protein